MKRTRPLIPLVALGLAVSCSENTLSPTGPVDKPFVGSPVFDDIPNNLDQSIDAVAEIMPLVLGGAGGTTQLYVQPRNDDGKNGCNFGGSGNPTLVVSVSSDNTSVATVSPASVTFDSCDDKHALTITPVGLGSATISLSETSNTTGATFNLEPAKFTVEVAGSSNTAPLISITGVDGGASYNKGSVPTAMCQVTDVEDGDSSFPVTLSAITGPYASDGIGSQTASCSYTDAGGLTAEEDVTYAIVDPSAPLISYVLSPTNPDGSNGWYRSAVSLAWTVTEDESPNSLQKTGCVDQSVTADQAETTYSCSATSAGGSYGPVSVSIKRDATAPSISGAATTSPNVHGWYYDDVVIQWTVSDATSGIDEATRPATSTITGEGDDLGAGPVTVADLAGNVSAPASVSGIKIDRTAPSVSLVGGPANGATYYFGFVPPAPTCSASDALSGLDGSCSVSGYSNAIGSHTATASVSDKAGNTASASTAYSVNSWTLSGFFSPVDMGGVYNTLKSGSTVPLKFRIFAGPTELTDVSHVKPVTAVKVVCGTGTEDAVEEVVSATGGTILRYDTTSGQFIYNWKASGKAGDCLRVTMESTDQSKIQALFKLK